LFGIRLLVGLVGSWWLMVEVEVGEGEQEGVEQSEGLIAPLGLHNITVTSLMYPIQPKPRPKRPTVHTASSSQAKEENEKATSLDQAD
jgi:hypothetical protein